jgi:hypothetical protein
MRPPLASLVCTLAAALACRSANGPASAVELFEGRADAGAVVDTVDEKLTIGLARAHWTLRERPNTRSDYWTNIALLDIGSADLTAKSVEHRTFAAALRTLMGGEPDAASVAFDLLRATATDSLVRSRARVGLTMALSWHSDWAALSRIGGEVDSVENASPLALAAGVERWAHAFSAMPTPQFIVPDEAVVLPMRRSAFGTPVITVKINGRPHEFWLDTGASMTLLTTDVAIEAGVKLAATDTLALGVVAGHVEARAAYID